MDSERVNHEAEAAAEGQPTQHSERRLEDWAFRRGWPISDERRQAICDRLMGVIEQGPAAGQPAPVRYVVLAARTLITADRLNLEYDKLQRRAGADAEHLEDLTDESEQLAQQRRRDIPRPAGPTAG